MAMNTSNTFRAVVSSRTVECLFACTNSFHRHHLGRPTGAMSVFDWKITIAESGKPVLALAFFDDISAVNSTQLFPCFSCFIPFFKVIKQNMANMLFKILHIRTTIATKFDRIATFFLDFRLSVNNKTRVNIWHSCHTRIQIDVDNAIYWKKRNDFLNNPKNSTNTSFNAWRHVINMYIIWQNI